jgi:hypothetical protein
MMEDSNRLFRFPKPAWMNSANTRTAGVYIAGALVRNLTQYHHMNAYALTNHA